MDERLGILVGGGPAPGINGVIAAATIEARAAGLRVIGIYDGFRHLVSGGEVPVRELDVDDVATIHTLGGSILRTSRTNPAKDDASLRHCTDALERLGIRYLVAIGGDDTTFGATAIARATAGRIAVVTVPKTIDNDLPLPDGAPTFGFETARSEGARIIENLLEDARTTSRWYVVVSMGRTSGALALGICAASGATLAVIPEEFDGGLDLRRIVDTLAGAIIKRRAAGHADGVAIVAEGIIERISSDALASLENVARDAYGHVRLADVPLGPLLRDQLRSTLKELGVDTTVLTKDIGYELRCAKPVAFDVDYTRTLGYGAVRYLVEGGSGALIALSGRRIVPLHLDDLLDPQTGRIRTRRVDVTTESYRVARSAMTRLEPADLRSPALELLASCTTLSPAAFRERFATIV
jgi:6-phosphofructokinase